MKLKIFLVSQARTTRFAVSIGLFTLNAFCRAHYVLLYFIFTTNAAAVGNSNNNNNNNRHTSAGCCCYNRTHYFWRALRFNYTGMTYLDFDETLWLVDNDIGFHYQSKLLIWLYCTSPCTNNGWFKVILISKFFNI